MQCIVVSQPSFKSKPVLGVIEMGAQGYFGACPSSTLVYGTRVSFLSVATMGFTDKFPFQWGMYLEKFP
jgi:hypothetical protein